MQMLLLFTLVSTALYYLGSRALITRWLWSRYPPKLARFADCPACTAFWHGVMLSLIFGDLFEPLFTRGRLLARYNAAFMEPYSIALEAILVGLCLLVLTPIVAGLMQHALVVVGSVIDDEALDDQTTHDDSDHEALL